MQPGFVRLLDVKAEQLPGVTGDLAHQFGMNARDQTRAEFGADLESAAQRQDLRRAGLKTVRRDLDNGHRPHHGRR